MADALFIPRGEPDNPGLSYSGLRERGIEIVQQLAGETWTDYNEHDPGVTILEQLCYALTELSYRAGLPVAELLAGEGVFEPARHALFAARDIFPGGPLTVDDYRRLVADRVPEVGNVWFSPRLPGPGAQGVKGLYDVTLHVPGVDPCGCDGAAALDEVRERVLSLYARHRNLCEDVRTIVVLAPVRTTVRAKVAIDDSRAPEAVLAELLFHAGLFLAPEIRREPLRVELGRGRAPGDLFLGPSLRNGFIGDDQLQDRVTTVGVPEMVRALARTSAVLGVREVSIQVENKAEVSGNGTVTAPRSGVLTLETRPGRGGELSIRLFRRGVACKVDPARALRELDRLWAEQRRRHPLEAEHDRSFPVPGGRPVDLAQYTSIQTQFPNTYGINAYGPPDEATPFRVAQTRQLKGYLMVFEQLLADFFAQLGHAGDLLSTDRALGQSYFHQSLRQSVPDAEPLLDEHYEQKLEAALRSGDAAAERRNRFLDVLLGLHGDGLEGPAMAELPGDPRGQELLARTKIALLEHLVSATKDRGRGFDYRAAPSGHDLAGMEIRSRIELGLPVPGHRPPLLESQEQAGRDLVEDHTGAPLGRQLYIVEHSLLRFGRFLRGEAHEEHGEAHEGYGEAHEEHRQHRQHGRPHGAEPFACSFTVSAVVSGSPGPERDAAFEQAAREVLRRNAPAHVAVEHCFLSPSQMRRFEELHRAWREALQQRKGRAIIHTSMRLRSFLGRWKTPA
jgi:hypothetical protein